jgi:hypothetical protein
VNIAAAMAALAIRDLEHTAKMAALVVACRADQDTRGGVALTRLALDLNRHPGALARTLRAVDGRYLVVDNSVVSLGDYFEPANGARRKSRRMRGAQLPKEFRKDKRRSGAAGAVGDNPAGAPDELTYRAAAAALAEARATLAARLDVNGRRRR